jgi:hypothetical protein
MSPDVWRQLGHWQSNSDSSIFEIRRVVFNGPNRSVQFFGRPSGMNEWQYNHPAEEMIFRPLVLFNKVVQKETNCVSGNSDGRHSTFCWLMQMHFRLCPNVYNRIGRMCLPLLLPFGDYITCAETEMNKMQNTHTHNCPNNDPHRELHLRRRQRRQGYRAESESCNKFFLFPPFSFSQ